ncbi:glutathione synthase [Pseudoalteromonas shioyasakiensis]|uniref:glutathione synthase n=1 Tax=Pseudoalteromonas shioyasakiensis TaxID=1190813 RepID=UPI00259A6E29|nr:glutathione synthase [uncultured Pseudoalteromonas sp.]
MKNSVPNHVIQDLAEWAIMHGVAFRQADNTARHCPFSIAPIAIEASVFNYLKKVIPIVSKLINNLSEDHDFLQSSLTNLAEAEPFFARLLSLYQQGHGTADNRKPPKRQPLLLMRTDFMDDRVHGAKVIEFNGIAAGMAPFGQRASELHAYVKNQWPDTYSQFVEDNKSKPVDNFGLEQMALGISRTAKDIKAHFNESGTALFVMVVQENEDNVYDQHLLELELKKLGVKTVRRTFEQLNSELSSGENGRLMLKEHGGVDVVYLRAGYQFEDYCAPELDEDICCHTLSQVRLFIEQHYVAMNATISQQLATSKSVQLLLTQMPEVEYQRWGLTLTEAKLVKSVLADMKPLNKETIAWFDSQATKSDWVLKNQGEGGGHCIFGDDITQKLLEIPEQDHSAWAFMKRLFPHEREKVALAIRNTEQTSINDLVSEIGLFSVFYKGQPATDFEGYAGYLIRSKPAIENEGGVHSGMGILDSLVLMND